MGHALAVDKAKELDAEEEVKEILWRAVQGASDFPLHPCLCLDGCASSVKGTHAVFTTLLTGGNVAGKVAEHAWAEVYKWRCALTFARTDLDFIWIEDKVQQRALMFDWPTGAAKPLPSRWFSDADLAEAEMEAFRMISLGVPFVVKPR